MIKMLLIKNYIKDTIIRLGHKGFDLNEQVQKFH